ncbi:caspase-1-like isoform X3 [Tupaia chinensis]|uniref:caspase-1-like isoform X3 n=1 Tax=Tupaia chinensis TaxID=246437 RepID=UPI000FFC4231|nr:caspase-1-like isoform X3 [Tupaia chinensis]XP_027628644.1 caspase-1-like isoform X3 [Tupaia chinensis]
MLNITEVQNLNGNKLKEKRKVFVDSVSEDTIYNLLDDVLSERVLNQEEVEMVKNKNASTKAKARDLIDFVIQKGSRASQIFIDYICKRDSILANKLGFSLETPATGTGPASEEYTGKLKLCPREKFLELRTKEAGKIYEIKEKGDRTRLALIICNTEFDHLPRRNGSNHDITGMKGLLEDLGYSVDVEENLTARAMELVLRKFAARPEHKTSDSSFFVCMSHGILEGICGINHSDENPDVLPYDPIFQILNNRNCPHLKDKPKVIIIQACRGGSSGEVWVSDSPLASVDNPSLFPENLIHDGVSKAHVEKDFVAFCSSTPHNVSWRSPNGSLFITRLIKYVQTDSWCHHLTEVFLMVQRSFEEPGIKAQMPSLERQTMTRYFYLFPGI